MATESWASSWTSHARISRVPWRWDKRASQLRLAGLSTASNAVSMATRES